MNRRPTDYESVALPTELSRLSNEIKPPLCGGVFFGGADRDRTDDLLVANEALSQLSYSPIKERRR